MKYNKGITKTIFNHMREKRGFTLIEILIVVAIIAILAAIVFIALDPFKRFQDARASRRLADVSAIYSAIHINQVDHGGNYVYPVGTLMNVGEKYMIVNATNTPAGGCITAANTNCAVVTSVDHCVNLQKLVETGYLGSIPVSPNGTGNWTGALSGYYMSRNANGFVTVLSCE